MSDQQDRPEDDSYLALVTELLECLPGWPGYDRWKRRLAALSASPLAGPGVDVERQREALMMAQDYFDMMRGEWDHKYGGDMDPKPRLLGAIRAALPQPGEPT